MKRSNEPPCSIHCHRSDLEIADYFYSLSSMSRLKTFCILPLGVLSKNFNGAPMILRRNALCSVVDALIVVNMMTRPRIRLVTRMPTIHAAYMLW